MGSAEKGENEVSFSIPGGTLRFECTAEPVDYTLAVPPDNASAATPPRPPPKPGSLRAAAAATAPPLNHAPSFPDGLWRASWVCALLILVYACAKARDCCSPGGVRKTK